MKNKLLTLGILSTMIIPVSTTVSCSTSWTSWSPDEQSETEFEFEILDTQTNLWTVRKENNLLSPELLSSFKNNVLDLELINNQYELMEMINHVIQLKTGKPIGEYWNSEDDFIELKTYLSQITLNSDIELKYKDQTFSFSWDVIIPLAESIRGIDEFALEQDPDEKELLKRQPVFVDETGSTINMGEVTLAGVEMLEIPAVASLLKYNVPIGLNMSKLVNMPLITYDAFKDLLVELGKIMSNVFNNNATNNWIKEKNLDFTLSYINGQQDSFKLDEDTQDNAHIITLMNAILLITQLN